ncbi:Thioredoxin-like [Tenacibaculum sp. MAR_2009_124]|uniref:TlpA family protein disulfide reductase n=1 Tax=Tenacibaculum sp. MAR_2009_124 TaxID=1250059 RepID=UPI00089A0BE9|nr:thioredoxin-like domain-containing protein [Tenacibaculum sp. MAR_2009_124]SEB77492.1 Thioredoxin-like [Tenacibaculum sp. MAR_2009_124]
MNKSKNHYLGVREYIWILFCFTFLIGCSKRNETDFSKKALQDILVTKAGDSIKVEDVFALNTDKKLVFNIWASWCKDCLNSIPKNNTLMREYSDFHYINISIDKNYMEWSKALHKYDVFGDHYYLPSGWDGDFSEFLQLDWIPRYLIVNEDKTIEVFDCTRLKENVLDNTLKN